MKRKGLIKILKKQSVYNKRFKINSLEYTVRINSDDEDDDNGKDVDKQVHINNNVEVNESVPMSVDDNADVNETVHVDNNDLVDEKMDNSMEVKETDPMAVDDNNGVNETVHVDNNDVVDDSDENMSVDDNVDVNDQASTRANGEFVDSLHASNNVDNINNNEDVSMSPIDNNENEQFQTIIDYYKACFEELLKVVKEDAQPDDMIGIKIGIPSIENTKPIGIHYMKSSSLNSDIITDRIVNVMQSNCSYTSRDLLEITVNIVQMPTGSGRISVKNISYDELLKHKKKCYIDVGETNDMTCLLQAIQIGKCLANKDDDLLKKYLRKNGIVLKSHVNSLIKKSGVIVNKETGCDVADIFKIQKVMPKYQITVYKNKDDYKDVLFRGRKTEKQINLFYFEEMKHFVAIKTLKGFFSYNYMCKLCDAMYNKNPHICTAICKYCRTAPPCKAVATMKECSECNRSFRGENCFFNHQTKKDMNDKSMTVCEALKICGTCFQFINKYTRDDEAGEHICGEKICNVCTKIVPNDHLCFIQPYTKNPPKKFVILFYDLETTQNTVLNQKTSTYVHEANLCVVNQICHKCVFLEGEDVKCENCKSRLWIFEHKDCVKKFIDFCEMYRTYAQTIVCIAHNAKNFDATFIMAELMKRQSTNIKVIMGGLKILQIVYKNHITFIDSINFLPMALSKFPKAFGLNNMEKGYYPHFFNTMENYNYRGQIPPIEMFGFEHFDESRAKDFLEWYTPLKDSNYEYNNRYELIKYCMQDVKLLREGCTRFMKDFVQLLGVNPFLQSFTLAQAVMLVFRKCFLEPDTLAIVPKNNYRSDQNQSFIGQKWLIYENEKVNNRLQFETVLQPSQISVDAFDPVTNKIYEFQGCFYHGHRCLDTFTPDVNNRNYFGMGKTSLNDKLERTIYKNKLLRSLGFTVEEMWECNFIQFLKENPDIDANLNNNPILMFNHLDARSSIFGGRTEVFRLYHKTGPTEKIRYLDFCSLYPNVNLKGKYIIGHPKIRLVGKDCDSIECLTADDVNGLIKCKILPPQNLRIPVLPSRINGKLFFTLCRTCAELTNIGECTHNEDQRALIGTYVLCEVKVALKYGYKILNKIEIWLYDVRQYDPVTKTGGIFTEYMKTFLKLKQEASGWPQDCKTPQQKENYIQMYKEKQGIELDPKNIMENPSYRNLAKLCANSLWGKLSQKETHSQTTIVNTTAELYELLSSPAVKVMDLFAVGENVWVSWKYTNNQFESSNRNVSLLIGCYTTAQARILLFNELIQLEKNILYVDTDSLIYVEDEKIARDYRPDIGPLIGQLTNELSGFSDTAYISEFCSTGPKSYAYRVTIPNSTEGPIEVCKCKGFSATGKNKKLLNFENFKRMVCGNGEGDDEHMTTYVDKKIKRAKGFKIITEPESKRFGFTFTKRVCIGDNYDTIPYGYKKPNAFADNTFRINSEDMDCQ